MKTVTDGAEVDAQVHGDGFVYSFSVSLMDQSTKEFW